MQKKTSTTTSQESNSDEEETQTYIAYFKLVNNVELVSEFILDDEDNSGSFTIINPMQVVVEKDPSSGLTAVLLTDYLAYSEIDHTTIAVDHIISMFPASEEIIDYYIVALEYSKNHQQPNLRRAIIGATDYLRKMMEESVDTNNETDYNEEEQEDKEEPNARVSKYTVH
jgi:hypothetical protein